MMQIQMFTPVALKSATGLTTIVMEKPMKLSQFYNYTSDLNGVPLSFSPKCYSYQTLRE
jgi:hypothetical protein